MKKIVTTTTSPNDDTELQRTRRPKKSSSSDFVWEADVFHLVGRDSVNMTMALSLLPVSLKESFQQGVIDFSAKGNYAHIVIINIIAALNTSMKQFPISAFDTKGVAQILKSTKLLGTLSGVKRLFLSLKARDSRLISDEALQLLVKTNFRRISNKNVLSDDPNKSWLTDEEYEVLVASVWSNYEDSLFSTRQTLIKLLSLQYGRRPVQISYLKIKDFCTNAKENNSNSEPTVNFPGAKDSRSLTGFRDTKFESHPILRHLWSLFEIQRDEVRELVETQFNTELSDAELEKLPLFITKARLTKGISVLTEHYDVDWRTNLGHQVFHPTPHSISRVLTWKTHGRQNISPPLSHRTGRPLVVSATRIRHTRARQLARRGVQLNVLSHWMGHMDPSALKAYYNDPAEDARKLNEAMAPKLMPLAMAFTGNLINSEEQASRHNDPTSRLEFAKDGELKNVGNCGKYSFCSTTSVPVPCYRCRHFEPLVMAPHQEVLEALKIRQKEESEALRIGGARNLLIPIDLSADIIAVQNCIDRCNAQRIELEIEE